jgi:murein DD-endopeptidase MepM/ murein hydrolase activator NlpD
VALDQVRALEAWARANAPRPVMMPNDLIPSPDVLHQRLDYWMAFPSLAGNPLTGSAHSAASLGRMQPSHFVGRAAHPTPDRSTGAAPTATTVPPAMESPAMAIWRWEHFGHAPVLPRAAPSPGAAAERPSVTAPAEALGATLALTIGGKVAGVAVSSRLAAHGRAGLSVSSTSDTAATNLAATALDVPVALSPLPTPTVTATVGAPDRLPRRVRGAPHEVGGLHTPITPTATVTGTASTGPISTALVAATPTQTGTGNIVASSDASPTAQSTFTPQSSSTPTPSPGQGYSQSGTAVPGATALVSATTPLTQVRHITAPVSLEVAVAGATPTLTITTALSATPPLTLVVTLPVTAARVLAPPGFSSKRVALERVLRQGEALYAQMRAREQPAEQTYRAQLDEVANLNTIIENRWYARYQAYLAYQLEFPRYKRRVAALGAYAHRLHLARLRHERWRKRLVAWTRYAQEMAAYKVALAARRQVPAIPISGTAPLTPTASAPLPRKPVMPPFPGPEPPPFTKPPPPWPGSRPVYAANPGPEPAGYPLPLPPEAVPPWDGVAVPLTVLSYGGLALGVSAAGREETTQNALLAAGAFDAITSYQDPIKGIITTYWGGRTIFQSFHPGIDIAAPLYTPIHAAAAGRVTWAGYAAPGQRHYSYGLCVIIQHNADFSTLYAHLDDEKYGLQVRVGDIVQQGQIIGYEGMTGWTTGPHLHFEIRQDNVQVNPLLLIPNPQD